MKKALFILWIFVLLSGCDSDKAPDCFRKAGQPITKTFELPPFDDIMTYSNVQLFITDGPEQKVQVETGKNLLKDIEISVKDKQLKIKNHNQCHLVRGYKKTKVYVTSPNIKTIKNGSQFAIKSTNTLRYDQLFLISENYQDDGDYHTDGDFKLSVDCEKLRILNNNISNYYLKGSVQQLDIGIYSGDARVEAADLVAQNITLYHRGTQDVILNPQQSIKGKILSTGNLILVNHPPVVEVERFYTGKLIYR